MKLYNAPSGNSKRVRIFIAEKNIQIPTVELELGKDTRTKNYKETVNSLGEVPALELEDGQIITESQAICRYLEALYPTPSLMGRTAPGKAHIDMWSERIYAQLFLPYGLMVKHTMALFSDVVEQVPAFAQSQRRLIPRNWQWLDNEMSDGRTYIAGDEFSFADIQAMVVLMIADAIELGIPSQCINVQNWADKIRRRPSWEA